MSYLRWHYIEAPKFILLLIGNYIFFVGHLFSVKLLINTLFSPWRKEVARKTIPGISFGKIFDVISFNVISSVLGFIVRISALIAAFIFLIFVILAGALLFVFWLLIPLFSLPIYLSTKKNEYLKEKNKFIRL